MLTLFVDKTFVTTHAHLEELREYSKKWNARVIIRGHAEIVKGETSLIVDRASTICEALKVMRGELNFTREEAQRLSLYA